LIRDDAIKLSRDEFEDYGFGHITNLVSRLGCVNYAVSLKSSRPISIRLISLVPAPIS
jgi:hypothetical protein